ncbi:MAG: substrate-binding domain-containing protein [Fimbriimonadaceae bacterium]|nr:substrate-binding domain-containing protein [Fimbriimonadaceae bacterium]
MSEPTRIATFQPWPQRWFPNREWLLLVVLAAECAVFGLLSDRFLTATNAFQMARQAVEVGLLATALTPVIISGGIDLAVGSLMGLAAVCFGWLATVVGLPWPLAALLTLLLGAACGAVNGLLIARLRLPALIVTLATWSLWRGLAEGLTGAIANYSDFGPGFLAWGQGDLPGGLPQQLPLFAVVVLACGVLLHRTAWGRTLYAVGHSPAAALHAGLPVRRAVTAAYVLSGALAALATVIYVARLGQAKADAGTDYELLAITAVVLGGTSIFGGRGTLGGSLLGLACLTCLETGLRLAALPAELAGILVGLLLIGAIGLPRLLAAPAGETGDFTVKNSQVAVLCAAVLAAGALVAGSNWMLVSSLAEQTAQVAPAPPAPAAPAAAAASSPASTPVAAGGLTVAMMPKSKGDPYFVSCRAGAAKAAKELGIELLWDGPTETDAAKQNEVVEAWITKGVDVIAVSVQNQEAISTVLRKARAKGIKVLTWDADALPDARDFLINQATPEGIGCTLVDEANRVLGGQGDFAIITSTLTAANQNDWIKHIKRRLEKYPGLKLVTIKPGEDLLDRALTSTQNVLKGYPQVKLVMAISAPAVPGAAEAVKQSGRTDVKVIGLSLPNMCKPYIHQGIVDCIVLWNTGDLGYLTVYAAKALHDGTLQPGSTTLTAGSRGEYAVQGSEVLLGKPFVFNKANVDRFDF